MDQQTIQMIETLFHEKVLLYAELAECFRKERTYLTALNIEALWGVSDEKNRICSEIEALRSRIASALDLGRGLEEADVKRFLDSMPVRKQGALRNALLHVMKLKRQIEVMRKENQAFVDDSLDFLDEMISLLAGEGGGGMMYSGRSRLQRTEAVCTMSREV